jgi:hypothetical protein
MSEIIRFIPKQELTARQNLQKFIIFARNDLELWSDLKDFSWDTSRWYLPFGTARFISFEHTGLHPRKKPEQHQLMNPSFTELSKAYLRYSYTLRPRKGLSKDMQALRVIEFALSQDLKVPNITKFKQRHWDRAVTALKPFAGRANICTAVQGILKTFADLGIVNVDPMLWNHPYIGLDSSSAIKGIRASENVKAKKLPNQDALLAIAEVFSRGEGKMHIAEDVLITCITGVLLSAPIRISETLRFRTDCLRNETDKNGVMQHYLAYWVGGLKEQVQQSVNFSEHANHETECNPVSETSLPLGV